MSALLAAETSTTIPDALVFAIAATVCLVGALGVVLSRNPVHSALCLVATLFGVAVLFVAQLAHFLAAVQVMVYAGAIVVLFLFVIMLLGVDKDDRSARTEPLLLQRPVALALGLVVLLQIFALGGRQWAIAEPIPQCIPASSVAVSASAGEPVQQRCLTDQFALATFDPQAAGALVDLDTDRTLADSTGKAIVADLELLYGTDGAVGALTAGERSEIVALRDSLTDDGASSDEVRRVAAFLSVEGDGVVNPRSLNDDPARGTDNVKELARDVFTYHLLAFEATGVLLIVAVVAAVVLAKRPDTEPVTAPEQKVSA